MSSVFNLDDDPIVIVVPSSANIPPGNITEADWLQIKDRVTVVEGYTLADLGDVDTDGDAGMVLVKQEDGNWAAGEVSGAIELVRSAAGDEIPDVRQLYFRSGLRTVHGGVPGAATVEPIYGTAAHTVAQGNHTHTQPLPVRVTTAPSGYISGGSQPLGSTSVTLPDGIGCVVEAELYGQFRGADSGAAYYTVSITIAGNTYTSPGGTSGFWCVQGVPDKIQWQHERRLTGTGVAVPVSASVAWHSGSGFNIDRTYLKVRVRPDR